MALYPCSVCVKDVKSDAIQCDICDLWVHRACSKLSKYEMKKKEVNLTVTIIVLIA